MDYSAFNPLAWLCFLAFCVVAWVAVKLFHAMHPDYPGKQDGSATADRS
jgi:hypothetical protein